MKRWRGRSAAFAAAGVAAALVGALALGTSWNASRADEFDEFDATESGDVPVVASNRWALVFDASRPAASSEEQARNDAAREAFCADLEASGVLPDHIFVFASTAEDESRRPTRATILNALASLRDVDGLCELGSDGEQRFWREDESAPSEAQIYLTAPGVAATDGGSAWFAPCDAPLENVDETTLAERWLRVDEIENALTRPSDERATPIQRTFLAINFLTVESPTRGAGAREVATAEVDLERSTTRGFDDEDEAAILRGRSVRVSTRNERWSARTVDSFYRTMSEGLDGCADLAGDRNGWVEAGELAEYVRANGRQGDVAIAINGNAVYLLCPSRRDWKVPAALYREIERTFTRPEFVKLRDSAKRRGEQVENSPKKGATK